MCSWCYAFQPELEDFLQTQSSLDVSWVMGGLAPDSTDPMDESLKVRISSFWHEIETVTRVSFNHDYWQLNTPYRSTYPSCRAVIAAESLKANSSQAMVKVIQSAYYQEAKNPSLEETLIDCAISIGLDEQNFVDVFKSDETEAQFQDHLSLSRQLQVRSFPTLYYINDNNQPYLLAKGFMPAARLEENFTKNDV